MHIGLYVNLNAYSCVNVSKPKSSGVRQRVIDTIVRYVREVTASPDPNQSAIQIGNTLCVSLAGGFSL